MDVVYWEKSRPVSGDIEPLPVYIPISNIGYWFPSPKGGDTVVGLKSGDRIWLFGLSAEDFCAMLLGEES